MVGVAIQFTGAEEAFRVIGNLAQKALHPRRLWQAIGEEVKGQTEARFDTSTGPDGSRWPDSLRVKLLQGGGKTLVKSGDMRRSLTVAASDSGAIVSVPKVYAAIHQFGGSFQQGDHQRVLNFRVRKDGTLKPGFASRKSTNFQKKVNVKGRQVTIPARPFLGLNEQNLTDILETVALYFSEGHDSLSRKDYLATVTS